MPYAASLGKSHLAWRARSAIIAALGRRARFVLAAAVVVLGVDAAPALAVSRADAVRVALAVVKPQALKGRIVVFATPAAVPKGSSLVEAGPRKLRRGPFVVKAPLTTRATWMVWADLAYGARLQHSSEVVFVDDATGVAGRPQKLVWWPLVNGKAPFAAGYAARRYSVWSNVPTHGARPAPFAARAPAAPRSALPPGATADDCLVTIGLKNDPGFKQDFPGVVSAFQALGVRAFNPGHPAGADPDGRDLADAVDAMTKPPNNCKDVVIYIDGHGYETGPTGVLVGYRYTPTEVRRGRQWYRMEARTVTAADVEGILRDHRESTFKVIVDACYSGRFVLDVPKSENPNLLALETASRADEVSWSYLHTVTVNGVVYESRTNNPGNTRADHQGRGEFTNGLIAGLTRAAGSATEVADAQAQGGSLLGRLIARAPELGKNQDIARWAGLTAPRSGGAYGGASDVTPPPPPTAPSFTVTGTGWWQHFSGHSAICVSFSTSPAEPNAGVVVTAAGGSVTGSRSATTRLDSTGKGTARFEIDAYGSYTITVAVTAGGKTVTQTIVVDVTSSPGSAPCG
jgi:hypothetical protein